MDHAEQEAVQAIVGCAQGLRPLARDVCNMALRAVSTTSPKVARAAGTAASKAASTALSAADGFGSTGIVSFSRLKKDANGGPLDTQEIGQDVSFAELHALGKACAAYNVGFAVATEPDGSRSLVFKAQDASVVARCLKAVLSSSLERGAQDGWPYPDDVPDLHDAAEVEGLGLEPGCKVAAVEMGEGAFAVLELHPDGTCAVTCHDERGNVERSAYMTPDPTCCDLEGAKLRAVETMRATETYQRANAERVAGERAAFVVAATAVAAQAPHEAEGPEPGQILEEAPSPTEGKAGAERTGAPRGMGGSEATARQWDHLTHLAATGRAGATAATTLPGSPTMADVAAKIEAAERQGCARRASMVASALGMRASVAAMSKGGKAPEEGTADYVTSSVRASLADHKSDGAAGRSLSALAKGAQRTFDWQEAPARPGARAAR